MKDIFFYPLSVLVFVGLIAYALSFSKEAAPINVEQGFELSGEQLAFLSVPDRLSFAIETDDVTQTKIAVLTSNVSKKTAPPSAGINIRLGTEFEKAFEGHTIDMIVRARMGDNNPAPAFQIGYFSIGANSSGWKNFKPTKTYQDYKIRFKKGIPAGEAGGDYAGIWPDLDGQGRTLNIESITVKPVRTVDVEGLR